MKKFTLLSMLMLFALMSLSYQSYSDNKINVFDEITTILEVNTATGNLPAIIDDGGATRGAGFNGEYVFVASREDGNHVYYWDVNNTSAPVAELDMTGVSGGTFTVADLSAVGDHIFVSNMVFAGGEFKLYHWDGVDATPSVLISYPSTPFRMGDAISVIGDPDTFASIVVSGHGTPNFYVWYIDQGVLESEAPEVFSFEGIDAANFARASWIASDMDYSLVSGPFGVALLQESAETEMPEVVQLIPQSFFPGWPMYAQIFDYEGGRYMSFVHVKFSSTEPNENVLYVLNISEGVNVLEAMQNLTAGTFADKVVHSAILGGVANGNASVSNDVVIDPFGNLWLMGFAAGNGFVVQKLGDAFMYTLPFVENFEGEGEETPVEWLPEGWLNIDADGDTYKWYWNDFLDDETGLYETYMLSRSWLSGDDGGPLTPDNWLITPQILLDEVAEGETIEMNFHVAPTSTDFSAERYEILVSTTDADPASFTMVWEETLSDDDVAWVWLLRNLDLTAYAGQSLYVAIRHFGSTDNDRIALERLEIVKETVAPEVADLILNVRMILWADAEKFNSESDFVDVAGTFNNWGENPLQLTALDDEFLTYNITIPDLVIGEEYEFKFRINGSWDDNTAEFPLGAAPRKVTIQETDNEYTFWYNDDLPTIVDLIDQNHLSIFPNPASSYVKVQSEEQINLLVISDITGRKIQEKVVNNFETSLDVSSFESGIYLITVHSENGISYSKVQVRK